MSTNIILYASAYIVIPIMCACMLYAAKVKKNTNAILGIRVPKEQLESKEIVSLIKCYKKEIWISTIILALLPIPACFIPSFSVSFFVWTIWIYISIIVPMIIYARYFNKCKRLKKEKQWGATTKNESIVVDLKIIQDKTHYHYHKWYLPAIISSVIPLIINCFLEREELLFTESIVLGSMAVSCVLFYLISFTFKHIRGEIVSKNSDINANYNRAKVRLWNLFLSWNAYAFAILTWLLWISFLNSTIMVILFMVAFVVYFLFLTITSIWLMKKQSCLRNAILEEEPLEQNSEEEEHWIGGMFYYNPKDTHTWIDKKVGVGTTINMATKVGKAFTIFIILNLLLLPCINILIAFEEYTPITLTYENNEVTVSQVFTNYKIEESAIDRVEIIHEIPDRKRVGGTALPNLQKGNFKVENYGRCKLCIKTTNHDFLLIKTKEGKYYIISGDSDEKTNEIYQLIKD